MGREGGVCGGKGGSQHLFTGNFYSNGVLGSTLPVAAGMALAEREKRHRRPWRRSSSATARSARASSTRASTSRRSGSSRSSSSSSTTATRSRRRRGCSWPATSRPGLPPSAFRSSRHDTTDVMRGAARGARARRRPRALDGPPLLPRARHLPLQPALKGDDFRDPDEIAGRRQRDPLEVGAGLVQRRRAEGDRRRPPSSASRTPSSRRLPPPSPPQSPYGPAPARGAHERPLRPGAQRRPARDLRGDERVYLLGEDLLDPTAARSRSAAGLHPLARQRADDSGQRGLDLRRHGRARPPRLPPDPRDHVRRLRHPRASTRS